MKQHKREAWTNARAISKDRHEMAAILRVQPDTVSKMLSVYGLPFFNSAFHNPPEFKQRVIDLYKSGLSVRAVAAEVGATEGKVAGILSRSGNLGARIALIKATAQAKQKAANKGRLVFPPKFKREKFKRKPDPVTPLHVPLEEREQFMCAYPYGDGPFSFCGHPKQPGYSYCPDHCAIVYRAPETRERAPRPR